MSDKIDDDERTNAVGLFNYARSYWRSAEYLRVAKVAEITHPHAPITFLLCHAIELYLKAYLRAVGRSVEDLRKIGHRVANLAIAATQAGLALDPEHAGILSHVQEEDVAIEARYIETGFKRGLPDEMLAQVAGALDRQVCATLVSRGLPVRTADFEPPAESYTGGLELDTLRVLAYLFRSTEYDDLGEKTIAQRTNLDHSIVRYHLDVLDDADFASLGSRWNEDNYWAITPSGRRYVVERQVLARVS